MANEQVVMVFQKVRLREEPGLCKRPKDPKKLGELCVVEITRGECILCADEWWKSIPDQFKEITKGKSLAENANHFEGTGTGCDYSKCPSLVVLAHSEKHGEEMRTHIQDDIKRLDSKVEAISPEIKTLGDAVLEMTAQFGNFTEAETENRRHLKETIAIQGDAIRAVDKKTEEQNNAIQVIDKKIDNKTVKWSSLRSIVLTIVWIVAILSGIFSIVSSVAG